MLTPEIITIFYWLLLLIAVVFGLFLMFGDRSGVTFGRFLMGLVTMLGSAIGARILCELLIVLFKIHENIKKARQHRGIIGRSSQVLYFYAFLPFFS